MKKMKKMRNRLLFAIGGILLSTIYSCNDDLLVENPTTFASPANLYKTAEDAHLVLTGAYDGLQNHFLQDRMPWNWGDVGCDYEIIPSWSGSYKGNYLILSTSSNSLNLWTYTYEGVQKCNIVINRVEKMDDAVFGDKQYGDETINEKNVILAEAKFIRGLTYFYAVMYFGNIPLVLEETTSFDNSLVSQATPAEVYEQVISDLQDAEASLPWVPEVKGHATKGAAKSLLAKVYLQMTGFPLFETDKFAMAAAKFKEVIDKAEGTGLYGLMDFYGDIFDYRKENNKEIVFAVEFKGFQLGEGNNTGTFQGVIGPIAQGGGYENMYVNYDYVATFDSSDIRFWWTITNRNIHGEFNEQNPPYWTPWKWHSPSGVWSGSERPFDWPVIRYADVLLMYAEALIGANSTPPAEAYWAINKVRARARLSAGDGDDLTPWLDALIKKRFQEHPTDANVLPDLANLTKEQFLTALLQEQVWELNWEGQRKAILIRTGKLKEYITEPKYTPQMYNYYPGLNFDENKHYWLPIPQREIDINPNLVQNPGY